MSENKLNYNKLSEVAEIDISGVDKKVKKNELEVLLCNYIDIYNNWEITNDMKPKFMVATATKREIQKFLIKKGQVAITKDSETKFDIGISSYIADDFENVLLGYHCVLIKPDNRVITGEYLNLLFKTTYAKKFFEHNASGSGQRYTLSKDVIFNFPLMFPALGIQNKVSNLISIINRKIKVNCMINDNLSYQSRIVA